MYGKKHTQESKEKMSINSKGKTAGEKNSMYGKKIEMYDEHFNLIQVFNAKTAVL